MRSALNAYDRQVQEACSAAFSGEWAMPRALTYICCSMQLVPAALVREYKDAMLNIHPGLLPAFGGKGLYGLRVHKAVIASGARFSGATVHFVDEEYDTGPILAQAVVPVNPHETPQMLAARVLQQVSLKIYPRCCLLIQTCSMHKSHAHSSTIQHRSRIRNAILQRPVSAA